MTDATTQLATAKDFASLPLSAALLRVVGELGYTEMTPIQARSLPALLAGRDTIGQAKTGSGKTVAYALPLLNNIRLDRRQVQALVLCPTRELCTQVGRELRKLGRLHPGLQVLMLAGGQPARAQMHALEKGAHIAVGTPGRIHDLLRRGALQLRALQCVVLDEADRMLDMGFQDDMDEIFAALPEKRQTVFFSATFMDSIAAMSRRLQKDPVHITISETAAAAVEPQIRQQLYEVATADKRRLLERLLAVHQPGSALVFCNHKASAAELAVSLAQAGISADALHGDLDQPSRDRVLAKFRNQSVRVLVATDVAARGIDVAGLELVCNLDLPPKPDTYVHRIGRTGRAGQAGLAISFMTRNETAKIEAIEALTGRTLERLDASDLTTRPAPVAAPPAASAPMATLYIAGGRKDKVRPGDILGALTGEAGGLNGAAIGKIEIHDRFAYVAVAKDLANLALASLRDGKIKGRKFQVEMVR